MKSDNVKKGIQQAPHRSLFNALGMTKEEMDKALEVENVFVRDVPAETMRASLKHTLIC